MTALDRLQVTLWNRLSRRFQMSGIVEGASGASEAWDLVKIINRELKVAKLNLEAAHLVSQ